MSETSVRLSPGIDGMMEKELGIPTVTDRFIQTSTDAPAIGAQRIVSRISAIPRQFRSLLCHIQRNSLLTFAALD